MRTRALALLILSPLLVALLGPASASAAGPRVLRVGSWHGSTGQFRSIQDAVDAAHPGDWILVGPGDYHETAEGGLAGVYIETPNLHLRGMDRNAVLVDGTLPSTTGPCDSGPASQDFGPVDPGTGETQGRNGVWVDQVSGVSVENLTACNFVSSPGGENGNEIWFDGGDGSGQQLMGAYTGRYLSATSTYYVEGDGRMGYYGLFADNTYGPGRLDHSYSSNMADAALYIGACPDCNTVVDRFVGVNSGLGYSGTNSGGHLIVQDSEFGFNRVGVAPNSLNNDDQPSPQDGACPNRDPGPLGTGSCTIFRGNLVHDNNNPNSPTDATTALVPIGTGIEVVGGQNDSFVGNTVVRNGGWGILLHDYPDSETPPPGANCQGGTGSGDVCFFMSFGNETAGNHLANNGFFGNPGNVDLGNEASSVTPGNCFHDNTDPAGLTSDPQDIETVDGQCGGPAPGDTTLAGQIVCASGLIDEHYPGFQCPGPAHYPQRTQVRLISLPRQPSMPDPCAGVPANPWCPRGSPAGLPHTLTGSAPADRPGRPGLVPNGRR